MQCIVLVQKKLSNAVSASYEKSDLALVRVFIVNSGRELCKPIRYSTLMLLHRIYYWLLLHQLESFLLCQILFMSFQMQSIQLCCILSFWWVELGERGVSRGGNRLWLWVKRCLVRSRDSSWGQLGRAPKTGFDWGQGRQMWRRSECRTSVKNGD